MGNRSVVQPTTEVSERTSLRDETEDFGKPYKYDPKFQGPVKHRHCTDVFCLLLFIAFLGGWGFVGYIAFSQGNIDNIIYPTNSEGEICGRGALKDRPYLLYFDLTKCLNPAILTLGCNTPQICIQSCPNETFSGYASALVHSNDWVKDKMRPYCSHKMDTEKWRTATASELIENEICPSWVLPSTEFLGRCLPTFTDLKLNDNRTLIQAGSSADQTEVSQGTIVKAVTNLGAFLNLRTFSERVFCDIYSTWYMIMLALMGAGILSFAWILLLRIMTSIMVWLSIALIILLLIGVFSYSLIRYLAIRNMISAQRSIFTVNFTPEYFDDVLSLSDTWLAFTVLLGIILLIIVLLLIALRQRIRIAIQMIEQGSKAVGQMTSTLFFPIFFPFVQQIILVAWFTLVFLYLSSAGHPEYKIVKTDTIRSGKTTAIPCPCYDPKTDAVFQYGDSCDPSSFNSTCREICPGVSCQFIKYVKTDDEFPWMQFYNVFGFYWGINFIWGLSELILGGVFATWYWTWHKKDVPFFILIQTIFKAIFFHLGTVAFGSLIIAVIQITRSILSYVESKLKKFNNDVTKCLLCMCKCCLYCLEKFMKFINRSHLVVNDEDFEKDIMWTPDKLELNGQIFFRECCRINGLWYLWVYIVGSKEDADKYFCKMKIISHVNDEKLFYKGRVVSLDLDKEEVVEFGYALIFPDVTAKLFLHDKKVHYFVSVEKKNNDTSSPEGVSSLESEN